jgi:hypothetical protein
MLPEVGGLERARNIRGLEPTSAGMSPSSLKLNHLPGKPQYDRLLKVWSARETEEDGDTESKCSFLELPLLDVTGKRTRWSGFNDAFYPSNKIFIRESYRVAAEKLLGFSRKVSDRGGGNAYNPMIVAGSSGVGKSYFVCYFIYRLLHPDGDLLQNLPDTIIWKPQPNNPNGHIYHHGHFYTCNDLDSWFGSSVASTILDGESAWVIVDGPCELSRECNILQVTSPGELMSNNPQASRLGKATPDQVFLPPWSFEETCKVAQIIHQFNIGKGSYVYNRYKRYGGIPRYVLQYQESRNQQDPLKAALSWSNILTALGAVQSSAMNHREVAGTLLHLFPDETLSKFTYQWGSYEIIEAAFSTLFEVEKKKIICFVTAGYSLNLGTFYGLLFEPFFHRQIVVNGYTGRYRKLLTPVETRKAQTAKRTALGFKSDKLNISNYKIPKLNLNNYSHQSEIVQKPLNVPTIPNHPTIDSLVPHRGEVFQVTCADRHEIKGNYLPPPKKYFADFLPRTRRPKSSLSL